MDACEDCYTIIGYYDDMEETTVVVLPRNEENPDPHMAALQHMGAVSQSGEFEVVAVLKGRCDVLVTQQSLRLFSRRLMT